MNRPTVGSFLVIAVGYLVLSILFAYISGVPYTEATDSVGTLVRGLLVHLGIFAVLLAALTTWLGWWGPVLRDDRPAPRWLWVVPALIVLGIAVGLLTADWGARSVLFGVVALVVTLCAGFNEELIFRGIGVVGLRARVPEWQVFLYTTLLFGLAHGLNFFAGQHLGPTASQMVQACAFGASMYVVRRVSGTLLLCIALHALWDWTVFVRVGVHAVPTTTAIGGLVPTVLQVVAVIVIIVSIFVGRGLFSDSRPAASRVR